MGGRAGGTNSGKWSGWLANPGVNVCHPMASIIEADGHGHAREILPDQIPDSVRRALTDVVVDPGPDGPEINQWWGEHGLTTAEKVFCPLYTSDAADEKKGGDRVGRPIMKQTTD